MKDISCKLLVIGAGPGGYVCAIRAGQLGIDTVIVEAASPAAPASTSAAFHPRRLSMRPRNSTRIAHLAGRQPARHLSEAAAIDLVQTIAWKDGIVGRLNNGVVSGLLKRAKVKIVDGLGAILRRQDRRGPDRDGPPDHPRRDRCDRHRLGRGRAAVPALRRAGDLVYRGAGADERVRRGWWSSAADISAWSSARPSPSWARRSRWSRRRPHPAAIRCRADAARRQAPATPLVSR